MTCRRITLLLYYKQPLTILFLTIYIVLRHPCIPYNSPTQSTHGFNCLCTYISSTAISNTSAYILDKDDCTLNFGCYVEQTLNYPSSHLYFINVHSFGIIYISFCLCSSKLMNVSLSFSIIFEKLDTYIKCEWSTCCYAKLC